MDLRQLRAVVAVVDEGTFTAAADALGISQPSLSQAVRTLENELGVELFHRTRAGVRLTAAGRALVPPARRTLRDAEVARAAVAEVSGLLAGRLDLVSLPTLAVSPVAALVGAFRRDHPRITVHLEEPEDLAAVVAQVLSGQAELGFTELAGDETGLVAHELAREDFLAVLPPSAEAAGAARRGRSAPRLALTALARHPVVTTPVGTSTRRQLDEALARAGLVAEVAVETDHREALVPLVLSGAGAAVMPRSAAEQAAAQGALVRELTPPVSRRVGLVHRPGPLSPAAHAFVALAVPGPRPARRRPPARRR